MHALLRENNRRWEAKNFDQNLPRHAKRIQRNYSSINRLFWTRTNHNHRQRLLSRYFNQYPQRIRQLFPIKILRRIWKKKTGKREHSKKATANRESAGTNGWKNNLSRGRCEISWIDYFRSRERAWQDLIL